MTVLGSTLTSPDLCCSPARSQACRHMAADNALRTSRIHHLSVVTYLGRATMNQPNYRIIQNLNTHFTHPRSKQNMSLAYLNFLSINLPAGNLNHVQGRTRGALETAFCWPNLVMQGAHDVQITLHGLKRGPGCQAVAHHHICSLSLSDGLQKAVVTTSGQFDEFFLSQQWLRLYVVQYHLWSSINNIY